MTFTQSCSAKLLTRAFFLATVVFIGHCSGYLGPDCFNVKFEQTYERGTDWGDLSNTFFEELVCIRYEKGDWSVEVFDKGILNIYKFSIADVVRTWSWDDDKKPTTHVVEIQSDECLKQGFYGARLHFGSTWGGADDYPNFFRANTYAKMFIIKQGSHNRCLWQPASQPGWCLGHIAEAKGHADNESVLWVDYEFERSALINPSPYKQGKQSITFKGLTNQQIFDNGAKSVKNFFRSVFGIGRKKAEPVALNFLTQNDYEAFLKINGIPFENERRRRMFERQWGALRKLDG